MTITENNQVIRKDKPVAALDALNNAALAYASLTPNMASAAVSGFPALGVHASSLLMNPAAVAAVAAVAAKQLVAQSQGNATTVTAASNVLAPAAFGHHTHPAPNVNMNHGHMAPAPSPAAALTAATALLPHATGNAALNHMSALLQSAGQVVHAHHLAGANTAAAAAAAAMSTTPTPPPPASSSPTPPAFQQKTVSEPAATTSTHNSLSAAAHVAVGHAVTSASTNAMPSSLLLPNLQNWSLGQLENHVNILHQMKRPVPQSVALLLADVRRKEEKKTAKRVANRKSACTSRARKKALVEEMTRTNARLRRQALILSLLPDLVIAISQEGEITFCSAQVERVLKHKIDDLIGADLRDILIPVSRTALDKMIAELTRPNETASAGSSNDGRNRRAARGDGDQRGSGVRRRGVKSRNEENGNVSGASSGSGGVSSGAAAVVSDQSFPLSVVKVDSKQDPPSDENDNSDGSGGGKELVVSSLSNRTRRLPSSSLANGGNGSEAFVEGVSGNQKVDGESKSSDVLSHSAAEGKRPSSGDDSSSGSTETKNIRKANENLERNVRWHNKKLQRMSKSAKAKPGHKDDVLGDSVTPNNALARLSSLQHYPETAKPSKKRKEYDVIGDHSSSEDSLPAGIKEKKKRTNNENASDDSGYRESNDSREETSSSASESFNCNGRHKPLAPTCNVCLIRENLTTLWCEVTSSIRTRSVEDDESLSACGSHNKNIKFTMVATTKSTKPRTGTVEYASTEQKTLETKELLLCLRPIRDGEGKVDKVLKFTPSSSKRLNENCSPVPSTDQLQGARVDSTTSIGYLSDPTSNPETDQGDEHPSKKCQLLLQNAMEGEKGILLKQMQVKDGQSSLSTETEKSVVESLMLMSHKSN